MDKPLAPSKMIFYQSRESGQETVRLIARFSCSFSERNPPAMQVRIKILRYKKPPFAKMEAGSPTAPKAKGVFVDERHTKFNTFQVEMPVPYRICTEISEERDIWKNQGRHRADTKKAM